MGLLPSLASPFAASFSSTSGTSFSLSHIRYFGEPLHSRSFYSYYPQLAHSLLFDPEALSLFHLPALALNSEFLLLRPSSPSSSFALVDVVGGSQSVTFLSASQVPLASPPVCPANSLFTAGVCDEEALGFFNKEGSLLL